MPGWVGWAALDGGYASGIEALGQDADGRLEVFGLAPAPGGQQVAHNWQTAPNNGWSGWAGLGAPPSNDVLSHLGVAGNADGRLEAFLRYGAMSAGELWHAWQTAPNAGWTGWGAMGVGVGNVTAGPIVVVANADGRLELFAIDGQDGLTHAWQTAPNGGWSSQASLGAPSGVSITAPAAARNADGRLAAFATGNDGAIWQVAQTAPNGGWGGWASVGKPAGDAVHAAVVGTNADGRLELFAAGSQGIWHTWQSAPSGGWSVWANLGWPGGNAASELAVGRNADGRLELFATVFQGDLWHIWQAVPNGGWAGWTTLGGEPYGAALVGRNQDGRLEVFVAGRTASTPPSPSGAWHRWQTTPGGQWS